MEDENVNESALTALQIEILRREGYGGQNPIVNPTGAEEFSNYESWHGRRLRGVLTMARRQSIASSVLTFGALAFGVAGAVVPGALPLSIPMLAVAAGGIVVGNTYLNIKIGDVRQSSPSEVFSRKYRQKVNSIEDKLNNYKDRYNELSKREQRKYAKLLKKEQKYVEKQYYFSVREWEKLLKKGDVSDFIKNPQTAADYSYDFIQFRKWGKVVNSLAQKHNEVLSGIPEEFLAKESKFRKFFNKPQFNLTEKTLENFKETKKTRNKKSAKPQTPSKKKSATKVEKKKVLLEDQKLFESYNQKIKVKNLVQNVQKGKRTNKARMENDLIEETNAVKL